VRVYTPNNINTSLRSTTRGIYRYIHVLFNLFVFQTFHFSFRCCLLNGSDTLRVVFLHNVNANVSYIRRRNSPSVIRRRYRYTVIGSYDYGSTFHRRQYQAVNHPRPTPTSQPQYTHRHTHTHQNLINHYNTNDIISMTTVRMEASCIVH